MIRAYTSILCAVLLYVGVVSIDRKGLNMADNNDKKSKHL